MKILTISHHRHGRRNAAAFFPRKGRCCGEYGNPGRGKRAKDEDVEGLGTSSGNLLLRCDNFAGRDACGIDNPRPRRPTGQLYYPVQHSLPRELDRGSDSSSRRLGRPVWCSIFVALLSSGTCWERACETSVGEPKTLGEDRVHQPRENRARARGKTAVAHGARTTRRTRFARSLFFEGSRFRGPRLDDLVGGDSGDSRMTRFDYMNLWSG